VANAFMQLVGTRAADRRAGHAGVLGLDNPLVWLLEVGGMVVDARWLPEAVQVQAWQTGLIPYVPAHAGGDDPAESLVARL
jgi:hypothetical protein